MSSVGIVEEASAIFTSEQSLNNQRSTVLSKDHSSYSGEEELSKNVRFRLSLSGEFGIRS